MDTVNYSHIKVTIKYFPQDSKQGNKSNTVLLQHQPAKGRLKPRLFPQDVSAVIRWRILLPVRPQRLENIHMCTHAHVCTKHHCQHFNRRNVCVCVFVSARIWAGVRVLSFSVSSAGSTQGRIKYSVRACFGSE